MSLGRTKIWAFVVALAFLQAVPLACFSFDCPARISQDHSCCSSVKGSSVNIGQSESACCRLHLDKPEATPQSQTDVMPLIALSVVSVLNHSPSADVSFSALVKPVPIPPRTDPDFVSPLRI